MHVSIFNYIGFQYLFSYLKAVALIPNNSCISIRHNGYATLFYFGYKYEK